LKLKFIFSMQSEHYYFLFMLELVVDFGYLLFFLFQKLDVKHLNVYKFLLKKALFTKLNINNNLFLIEYLVFLYLVKRMYIILPSAIISDREIFAGFFVVHIHLS